MTKGGDSKVNEIRSEWNIAGLMVFFTILVFTHHIGQLLWGVMAIATLFWIFMLCDCLQRSTDDFPRTGDHDKLIWSVVLVVLNFIGAVMYYFLVRMQDNGRRQT